MHPVAFLNKYRFSFGWLLLYYAWWVYLCFRMLSLSSQLPDEPFPWIMASIVLVLLYSAAFIIQIVRKREPERTSYIVFLGIVKLPAVIGFFFLAAGS